MDRSTHEQYRSAMARAGVWSRRGVLALAVPVAFGACEGDTLYGPDADGVEPPAVEFLAPAAGTWVQANQFFPLAVVATDDLGIRWLELSLAGIEGSRVEYSFEPALPRVDLDTVLAAPSRLGQLDVVLRVRNTAGAETRRTVALTIKAADPNAPAPAAPMVSASIEFPERVERVDTLRVRVVARPSYGGEALQRMGFTGLVIGPDADTVVLQGTAREFDPAWADGDAVFAHAFVAPVAASATLPLDLEIQVHAFAVDTEGRCAAALPGRDRTFACVTRDIGDESVILADESVGPAGTRVVSGRSVALPAGAAIADVLPDAARGLLFLSNRPGNRVEVLDLGAFGFHSPVIVGAQPWGLGLNREGDTLIVANSGGTNISYVTLDGTRREALDRRLRTPNTVIFDVRITEDDNNWKRLHATFHDFSDRPQFLAQDAAGRLLYSTVPTGAAPDGTIRVAERLPGWAQPEVRLLLTGEGEAFVGGEDNVAIGNVDSLRVYHRLVGDDLIEIYDHRPGFPDQIVRSGILPLQEALDFMTASPDSDIVWGFGRWRRERIGLSDTTFVAVSADRGSVAFGEGAAEHGRVFLWNAATASISNEITTRDLVGNTAERLVGVDLSADGSLGVARGTGGAYFFTSDLRLQGAVAVPATTAGGAGAVLPPDHPAYAGFPPSGAATLSFVATPQRTVRVYDTVHFLQRGEIHLRDNIVGPLRVSRPTAAELAACAGAACAIAKLYGITDAGAVVVIDVWPADIGPAF